MLFYKGLSFDFFLILAAESRPLRLSVNNSESGWVSLTSKEGGGFLLKHSPILVSPI